jgi:hypothetical protein
LPADPTILENFAYRDRLRLYRGAITAEELLGDRASRDPVQLVTQGYGVANWHFVNGRTGDARALWRKIVVGTQWNAFGFIAAEAELARD